jgi:hypothetical protein
LIIKACKKERACDLAKMIEKERKKVSTRKKEIESLFKERVLQPLLDMIKKHHDVATFYKKCHHLREEHEHGQNQRGRS